LWEERALALALSSGDVHLRMKVGLNLLLYYGGQVMDLAKAKLISDALRPLATTARADPSSAILWHYCDAIQQLHLGHVDACLEAASRGLAISDESGLRAWDWIFMQTQVFAALQVGALGTAEQWLQRMADVQRPGSGGAAAAAYHHCAVLVALRRLDVGRARQHARACRELSVGIGSPNADVLFGISCVLAGPPESLEVDLEALLVQARRCGNRLVQAVSLLMLATGAVTRGDEERGVGLLRDGFAAARDLGVLFLLSLDPGALADCCALALERGIEPAYIHELIRSQHLAPSKRAYELGGWPWEVRIDALGGLSVTKNGEPLQAGRKVQRRSLEMLRLLVAHGELGIRQDLVAELLWPDAEGDAAHHAFETAVYRLRRLLGTPGAVVHRDGLVALDQQVVYVDVWALERLLAGIEAARPSKSTDARRIDDLRARVQRLYKGDLFGEDGDAPQFATVRERLRGRVQRCLESAARPDGSNV
jgi:hypothetical protein